MNNINWKIWASIGIVIVAAVFVAKNMPYITPQVDDIPQAEIVLPAQELPVAITTPATGDVDDAINAILKEVIDEQALFADEEKDTILLGADSQAVSDFGQSFNENEL